MKLLLAMPGGSEWIFIFLALLPFISFILFLNMLQKTLRMVSLENQKIKPNQVWMSLIPLFGFVWQFIMIARISESLKAEFVKLGILNFENKPGYNIGLAYCILFCCSIIPILGVFAAIAGFVCWLIYWNKISKFQIHLINRI